MRPTTFSTADPSFIACSLFIALTLSCHQLLPLAGFKPVCFLLQAVPRLAVVFLGFGQPSRGGTASMSRAARATWAGRLRRAWSWVAYENFGVVRERDLVMISQGPGPHHRHML